MKEKYQAFKKWKKNPRNKALYQLLCWFLFFFILYIVAISGIFSPSYTPNYSSDSDKVKVTSNSIDNYGNMQSYEYEYNIIYNNENIVMKGLAFEDNKYYTIDNNTYYDDGTIYMVDDENKQLIADPVINLPITITEIESEAIYNWLKEAVVDESIEYNDGNKTVTYIYEPTEEYAIKLIAKEKDYLIYNIEVDLTEFLLTKNIQISQFKININYTNVNNISSYDKNYDDYELINVAQNEELEDPIIDETIQATQQ